MEKVLGAMGVCYEVVFSLDPSPDKTAEVILAHIERNPSIRLMVLPPPQTQLK